MANPYSIALGIMAIVALICTYRLPRAWIWIGLASVSYVVSSLYWQNTRNYELLPVVNITCDAALCWAIYAYYKEDWEIYVFIAYLASVFGSLLMLGGFIHHLWVYGSVLEAANAAAMLFMIGTGIIDMAGKNERSVFNRLYRNLHQPRVSVE